jgi:hypothetical protein
MAPHLLPYVLPDIVLLEPILVGKNIETYAFQCLACFLKHRHDPCEKAISPYLGLGFSASFAYFWVRIQPSSQPEFPAKAEPIAILFIPEKDGSP